MRFTHNQRLNPGPMGLSLCAATLLLAAGCSTIVSQGRRSPTSPRDVKKMDPWVWGNAAFAVFPPVAVLGLGIDALSGNWYRYTESADRNEGNIEENPFNSEYRKNDK